MPLLHLGLTVAGGVRVRVRVALDQPSIDQRRQAGLAIPQTVDVDALLDPGAQRSCLDPAVVARVGLPLYALTLSAAPGTGQPTAAALGGAGVNTSHTAGLTILHPTGGTGQHLVVPRLIVQALPLRPLGYDALIGRDILSQCVLVSDGPAGAATLAY